MAFDAADNLLEKTLTSRGILSEDELRLAREVAGEQKVSLAKALLELEVLNVDDLAALFADVCSVRALKLEDVEIDRESVRHVPGAVAHRHKLIPVRRSGNTLVVAMADPTDKEAWSALRAVTDFEVVMFVARMDAIEHALHIHYGEAPEEIESDASETVAASGAPMMPDERFAHIGRSLPLNRNLTFDSFFEDAGSRHPLGLARAVVSGEPEERSCPLLISGPAGCGKSHLLHAIANYLTSRDPLNKYILTNGTEFSNNLFDCLRKLKANLFRYFYRDAKYLLLDDCDALLNKPWAQSELAETIKAIRSKGGWVVLGSDQNLLSQPLLLPELRAVLESGQTADFESYTPEGRARILERQIGQIDFPKEALTRLSNEFGGDMKHLQELLRQFAAVSVLESREVTEEAVTEMLAVYGSQTQARKQNTAGAAPAAMDSESVQ